MLKGISPYISPELLALLHRMGHGDEIVLADAHLPGHSLGPQVLRADGIPVKTLLEGILPLFELDSYAPPLFMMEVVPGDTFDPAVERDYMEVVHKHAPSAAAPERLERYAFYARAKTAFAVVVTGELRKYGNLILKKGVTPVALNQLPAS
jgi:L-fucose mutarotase